ncbi:hypothetical protein PHLGIDRAFT_336134 [Phlebiopsis gigantea 11061_1 CR5-6]|uniref:Heterokaryon incompatibility domain-containing protein n=1 Tax=Phlebiopsis gigantea (strain 11061_1 CR5-6) TaxID=745531 RepID=A0A0C3S2C1_PHLG1|nr:hypothetical protein PHLGIDRAFT_336134 [Phlebiopsis gigantea 11061_1 CR5-6]
MNDIHRTNVSLGHPGIQNLLDRLMTFDYDFGALYARLRLIWPSAAYIDRKDDIEVSYESRETVGNYQNEKRTRAITDDGTTIRSPYNIPPRRLWDLYAHRVVPFHIATVMEGEPWMGCTYFAVSHSWTDPMSTVDTPVNAYEWPVPIPPNVTLEALRTEFLNLGAQYVWLDVLCLRQSSATPGERLRADEWAIDVPTIGNVYSDGALRVIRYYNGLGKAFQRSGWDNSRHWLRRAWTLQEIKQDSDTAGLPVGLEDPTLEVSEDNGKTLAEHLRTIHEIEVLYDNASPVRLLIRLIEEMRRRFSVNPVDKVAGIGMLLRCPSLPVYREARTPEHAWRLCVRHLGLALQMGLLFCFTLPGEAECCWRPSWAQSMEGKYVALDELVFAPMSSEGTLRIMDDGAVMFLAPVIRDCQLNVATTLGRYQRGVATFLHKARTFTVNVVIRSLLSLDEGTYVLVGESARKPGGFIVCKPVEGHHKTLEKITILTLEEDEEGPAFQREDRQSVILI